MPKPKKEKNSLDHARMRGTPRAAVPVINRKHPTERVNTNAFSSSTFPLEFMAAAEQRVGTPVAGYGVPIIQNVRQPPTIARRLPKAFNTKI